MSERDLERQGRPSRGTPTPPGYGYLTHHLPRKVAHARISDSATEQVLTLEKFSTETTFVLFNYIDNGILKTTRGTLNGKADRAEELLRLRDTDTSLITFREKQLSLAQTILLPTKSPGTRSKRKRDAASQHGEGVIWPRWP